MKPKKAVQLINCPPITFKTKPGGIVCKRPEPKKKEVRENGLFCPTCGQSITDKRLAKNLREKGFPVLAKLIEHFSLPKKQDKAKKK